MTVYKHQETLVFLYDTKTFVWVRQMQVHWDRLGEFIYSLLIKNRFNILPLIMKILSGITAVYEENAKPIIAADGIEKHH